jgi:hypothetical protein
MQFDCGTRILRVISRAGRPCHFGGPRRFVSKVDWGSKEFRVSSCDFVDRAFCPENKDDPRRHTNQHEPK